MAYRRYGYRRSYRKPWHRRHPFAWGVTRIFGGAALGAAGGAAGGYVFKKYGLPYAAKYGGKYAGRVYRWMPKTKWFPRVGRGLRYANYPYSGFNKRRGSAYRMAWRRGRKYFRGMPSMFTGRRYF